MIIFEIDPNVVRPGWTPLIITVVLAIAMVFLYRSMKRQFGRIEHLPTQAEVSAGQAAHRQDAVRPASQAVGSADATEGVARELS